MIVSGAFSLRSAQCFTGPVVLLQKLNMCTPETMVLGVLKMFIKPSAPIAGRGVKGTRTVI